jgi:hypothetical protein
MKIFLLGDSFTCNLFAEKYDLIEKSKNDKNLVTWVQSNEIGKYLIKLNELDSNYKAKWFDDWLREWGYDVYNFGKGGCSIEDIIYQFSKIKDFDYNDGDRIIINWTHPSRFNWITDNLGHMCIHSNTESLHNLPKELFANQTVNREMSFFNDKEGHYLNENLLPFMEYIIEIHSRYNPIVWSPFADVSDKIINHKWSFSFIDEYSYSAFLSKTMSNWSMGPETSHVINDGHFGQYGNYYIALLFDEIIKNNLGPNYNGNRNFIFKNVLNRIDLENKEFITKFD